MSRQDDRSDAALRERLGIAEKATPKGESTLWMVDPAVPRNLCIRDAFNERILTMEDCTATATAHHIAASSPDVVREDIEEILKMRAREDWLIEYICNKCSTRCPMPEGYRCKHKFNNVCYLNPSETEIRKQCWREAARKAVEEQEATR